MILNWHLMSELKQNNTATAHTAVVNKETKGYEEHDHCIVEVNTFGLFILRNIPIELVNW